MKTRFIVNPRSGRAQVALSRVRGFADACGGSVAVTAHPRHATELARAALDEGCERVVAVGGDGTLNEVASVLVGTEATLGLVPCGSGDGLGRHLGIHGSIPHALKVLETGRARWIDTGTADGHPFFTAAGLGFEAEISSRFNQLDDRGLAGYLRTAAGLWRHYEPQEYRVEGDHWSSTVRAFTIAVANSDQYGNGARIAARARIDDGLLDLTAVPPVTLWNGLPLLARLFTGTLAGHPEVVQRTSARFIIERQAPGLIHTDGEEHAAGTHVEFVVRPRSLRVMAPAAVA